MLCQEIGLCLQPLCSEN